MMHEALESGFHELIDGHAPVSTLASGCEFTEGPIWHPLEHHLLFSDMPGDVRRRWDNTGVREVLRPSNKANGMTYDAQLNLVMCEHSTSSLARLSPDGTRSVLASHFEGQELNSPNDVCMRSCGSLYFTDPWYGRMPGFGIERERELGWQGVFRVRPRTAGGVIQQISDPDLVVDRYLFGQPNGLCFSPDERLMYINDTEQANIRVFDVTADGYLKNGRLFASGIKDNALPGVPDGMKCDAHGNVWVTAPGGLWVYSPQARLLGKVSIPELAANLHWGGDDWRTLFICATTSVYAINTRVGPRAEPFMQVQGANSLPEPVRSLQSSTSATVRSASDKPSTGHEAELIDSLILDPQRCALIIQDMQNDVVMDGGAFADSGSPAHCREQNAIANIRRLADTCRRVGIPVIHVWFLCEPGYPGITLNAPLFEGLTDANALLKDTWGGAPVAGLEPQAGDHVVNKMRMSAFEGTHLDALLKSERRDIIIETGAWTNMSIEHTARTGADKGYTMIIPEDACSTMNHDWHRAAINYALTNVAAITQVDTIIEALS